MRQTNTLKSTSVKTVALLWINGKIKTKEKNKQTIEVAQH